MADDSIKVYFASKTFGEGTIHYRVADTGRERQAGFVQEHPSGTGMLPMIVSPNAQLPARVVGPAQVRDVSVEEAIRLLEEQLEPDGMG